MLDFLYKNRAQIFSLTLEHLWMVGIAMAIAVAVGVPLGILVSRTAWLRKPVLGGANVLQTIPSLALFGFLLPAPWLGERAERLAIVALVLYALLPIVRNTYTGILEIDPAIKEAAVGMGMTTSELLTQIELPLAAPVLLAGIRIATVTAIGVATIAAAIGAGGLGELIFRGVAMVNNDLILAGALPAAILALAADFLLGAIEKRFRVNKMKE
ncbi:MAG: ABC transporter permease [Acidobacteria bacterium]|nr:ABC transporter permease [Acidobacteriota bacterium]